MTCGIVDEFSDALEFHASLLNEVGKVWQRHILEEVERCEKLASAARILDRSLTKRSEEME